MVDCVNKARNLKNCGCTYDCNRRGMCCECVPHHRAKGQIPGCFFTKEGERLYDRSMQAFLKDRG